MVNFALFIDLITTGSLVAAMPYSTTGRAEHKGKLSAAINNTSAAINTSTAINNTSAAINNTSATINNTSAAINNTSAAINNSSAAINNTSATINNTTAAINTTGKAERLDLVGKVLESIFMSDPVVWVARNMWSGFTWVNSQASHVLGFL